MSQLVDTARNVYLRVKGFPKPPLVLLGHTHWVWSVAFLPDGQEVISGSADGSARRWRVEDGCEVGRALMWEEGSVLAVDASSDGNWIATACQEKNITIWNAATCDKVLVLKGHTDRVRSLAFSPDSARLVSGSRDKTLIVWSTTTGERLLGPLIGHTNTVGCACFSPNGDKIASCDSIDIRIWNSHSGDLVIRPIKVSVCVLTWTPDGQQLIAGIVDGSIKCISSSTGSLLVDWKAHTDIVHSIAVSPNGKFVASASVDKTVRLWDMTTSTQIGPPLQCDDNVYSVAISPAGNYLVSGGRDCKVRIWNLKGMVSPSLLKSTPATSNVTVRSNRSSSSPTLVMPAQQEFLSSLEGSLSEQPPTAPPNAIINGQQRDPSSLVSTTSFPLRDSLPRLHLPISQALPFVDGSNASSGNSIVEDSTALEQPRQRSPWNLDDIRFSFPNDLTGSVTREGEHPFASGSYGDIYRGTLRVRGTSTDVAVKAIRTYSADDGNDAEKKKRLKREIRVWLNLKHINVLPLFGTTMGFGQFPAMVCPWLEDGPLTSYLERRDDRLTMGKRLVLLHDVAVGLQYLHSQTVVHGDLSGSNVLIHGDGRACIADFGLSTLLTALGDSTFATTFRAKGTLRWGAPECLYLNDHMSEDGENVSRPPPTPGSDIYSFGRIMLQVLSGKIPFHYYPGDAPVVLAISQGETPKRPSGAVVTDDRWTFIERCWSSVDARPSDDEIVEFTRNELVQSVLHQV